MEGATNNVWPFFNSERAGMRSRLKKEQGWEWWRWDGKGKKKVRKKWEKWHLKYQRESYMYSCHVLSWCAQGLPINTICSSQFSKVLETMGWSREKGREGKYRETEWLWDMSGGTGNKPTSILAQSFKKNKSFCWPAYCKYRLLVNSEEQPC